MSANPWCIDALVPVPFSTGAFLHNLYTAVNAAAVARVQSSKDTKVNSHAVAGTGLFLQAVLCQTQCCQPSYGKTMQRNYCIACKILKLLLGQQAPQAQLASTRRQRTRAPSAESDQWKPTRHISTGRSYACVAVLVSFSHIVAHELLHTHHTTEMHAAEIVALHYKLLRWL